MAWFGGLFGGSKNTGKVLDIAGDVLSGVGGWIDGKDFTPQEKAVQWSKAVDSHLALVTATATENSARSITRRWMAWGIVGFNLFWASVGMVFAILGKKEIVTDMVQVATAYNLGLVFLAVCGFYFGVQLLRK